MSNRKLNLRALHIANEFIQECDLIRITKIIQNSEFISIGFRDINDKYSINLHVYEENIYISAKDYCDIKVFREMFDLLTRIIEDWEKKEKGE